MDERKERFRVGCNDGATLRPESRQTTVCHISLHFTADTNVFRLHYNVLSCMDNPSSDGLTSRKDKFAAAVAASGGPVAKAMITKAGI